MLHIFHIEGKKLKSRSNQLMFRCRVNYVFQNFIKVIGQKEHPLVNFLDDLQWVDAASLELIRALLADPDLNHFLLIGAYRDNEVDATHPLMMVRADQQKKTLTCNT